LSYNIFIAFVLFSQSWIWNGAFWHFRYLQHTCR